MNLFKKAAVFTDLHVGLKSNSIIHNEDCLEYINWFINTAKNNNCETAIMMGDWHNHRSTINVLSLNYSLRMIELLNDNFDQFYIIPGNHDLFYRDRRDVNSVEWAKNYKNITIINDFITHGDVTFCPWLVQNDHKKLKKLKSKYVFGHFELPDFYMNSLVKMPNHGEHTPDDFVGVEQVFSGHFHKRQTEKNICYIGNAFPHNYSDVNDDERGMMIVEWDKKPQFFTWPNQPSFRKYKLSQLLDNPDYLKPKQYIQVSLDIDINFEEATFIKENFMETYKLRELILISKNKDLSSQTSVEIQSLDSIDKIMSDQISSIDSDVYDKKLLLSIYNTL